jgi:tRNA (cytidine56-2'-O)-methyltransferase
MITIFRYGHRIERDKRVTTHCALVSRAFGANKMIYCGQEDPRIAENIESANSRFGSDFKVEYVKKWEDKLKELKKENIIIHLTMYGIQLDELIKEFKAPKDKGIVIVVGSQKVPPEVYDLADYNVSVTNQPHSEIASLAIALDRINPDYLKKDFNGKLKIIPCEKGKKIEEK